MLFFLKRRKTPITTGKMAGKHAAWWSRRNFAKMTLPRTDPNWPRPPLGIDMSALAPEKFGPFAAVENFFPWETVPSPVTLPMGIRIRLDADRRRVSVLEAAVR